MKDDCFSVSPASSSVHLHISALAAKEGGIAVILCCTRCVRGASSSKVAVEEIKKLATAKARHAGGEEEEQIWRAFTKLSVLLMRGNAAILANRIPAEIARIGE